MINEGRLEKEKGMARVLKLDFKNAVLDYIETLPENWIGLAEDIRLSSGLVPHHPNAWGAAIYSAMSKGLLEKTGHMKSTKDKPSHSRPTMEYRVTQKKG
jgi:hypothetical protein